MNRKQFIKSAVGASLVSMVPLSQVGEKSRKKNYEKPELIIMPHLWCEVELIGGKYPGWNGVVINEYLMYDKGGLKSALYEVDVYNFENRIDTIWYLADHLKVTKTYKQRRNESLRRYLYHVQKVR